eukprot:gene19900-26603_t
MLNTLAMQVNPKTYQQELDVIPLNDLGAEELTRWLASCYAANHTSGVNLYLSNNCQNLVSQAIAAARSMAQMDFIPQPETVEAILELVLEELLEIKPASVFDMAWTLAEWGVSIDGTDRMAVTELGLFESSSVESSREMLLERVAQSSRARWLAGQAVAKEKQRQRAAAAEDEGHEEDDRDGSDDDVEAAAGEEEAEAEGEDMEGEEEDRPLHLTVAHPKHRRTRTGRTPPPQRTPNRRTSNSTHLTRRRPRATAPAPQKKKTTAQHRTATRTAQRAPHQTQRAAPRTARAPHPARTEPLRAATGTTPDEHRTRSTRTPHRTQRPAPRN